MLIEIEPHWLPCIQIKSTDWLKIFTALQDEDNNFEDNNDGANNDETNNDDANKDETDCCHYPQYYFPFPAVTVVSWCGSCSGTGRLFRETGTDIRRQIVPVYAITVVCCCWRPIVPCVYDKHAVTLILIWHGWRLSLHGIVLSINHHIFLQLITLHGHLN